MLKPRLIFTLLYANGVFNLSRNFNLQMVGDWNWLKNNYEFESIAQSIDELVVINVGGGDTDFNEFCNQVEILGKFCFMPLAAGGMIRSKEQASKLFNSGADKIVLNSPFFNNENLVREIIQSYGSQAVMSSIDFKKLPDGKYMTFIENGTLSTGIDLNSAVKNIQIIGAGELYLTSIDRDGTGFGYDLEALEIANKNCQLPIIASGGADTYDKLIEGLQLGEISAVSTSHLFNFICDGLKDARESMIAEGISLSKWSFNNLNNEY
jgi:cyclase